MDRGTVVLLGHNGSETPFLWDYPFSLSVE